jgi:hypothetical protein
VKKKKMYITGWRGSERGGGVVIQEHLVSLAAVR